MNRLIKSFNPRFSALPNDVFQKISIKILDIGCGIRGARSAKKVAENIWYEGVDQISLNDDLIRDNQFDKYWCIDLNKSGLDAIQNEFFDVVICSHVIEHLNDGPRVVEDLSSKVKLGGWIYLEWPSDNSKYFPIRGLGLNFYDDPTHVRTYSYADIARQLEDIGFEIIRAGFRRHALRMLFAPLLMIKNCIKLSFQQGKPVFKLYEFWDWTSFSYAIVAKKARL